MSGTNRRQRDMKQLLSRLEETDGKTIDSIVDFDKYVAIHFTDGTAIVLKAIHSYGDTEIEVENNFHPADYEGKNLRIFTQQEHDSAKSERERQRSEYKEKQDYQDYLKLKEKFEK